MYKRQTENIILGIEDGKKFSISEAKKRITEITERYGFKIEPDKKIYEMSVSEKQTVEIIKVLYRGADILILDEPTAVLTPQETDRLFSVLKRMRSEGKSVIILSLIHILQPQKKLLRSFASVNGL